MALNDTLFKGRLLRICPKRTNIPGLSMASRGKVRGRGGRFRGTSRGVGKRGGRRGRGGRRVFNE